MQLEDRACLADMLESSREAVACLPNRPVRRVRWSILPACIAEAPAIEIAR
jgi:hypothetical protein